MRRPETQLLRTLLDRHSITLLVDVGANQGQYATRMRALGFTGRIESFEPGSEAFGLLSRFASTDPLWVPHQIALAEAEGVLDLRVSHDSVSSSVLPVVDAHLRAAPRSAQSYAEVVRAAPLDDVLTYSADERIWLKLDTQGFEAQVLRGATAVLDKTWIIQTELALMPCYDGQASYQDVMSLLHTSGFLLAAVEPGTQDLSTGEMLQFDGVFLRVG